MIFLYQVAAIKFILRIPCPQSSNFPLGEIPRNFIPVVVILHATAVVTFEWPRRLENPCAHPISSYGVAEISRPSWKSPCMSTVRRLSQHPNGRKGRQQVARPCFYERSPKGSIPDVVYMRIAHRGETPTRINSGFE